MAEILVVYSTTDGHTREICHRLVQELQQLDHRATLISIDHQPMVELKLFDKIVLGASIRYGKHSNQVYAFIDEHLPLLSTKPSAFFSVNLVARKSNKNQPQTNPYMKKFIRQITWQPKALAVFAGKIDYRSYRFCDRQLIRLIMWMTNGPTDPAASVSFTDWQQVAIFAQTISKM